MRTGDSRNDSPFLVQALELVTLPISPGDSRFGSQDIFLPGLTPRPSHYTFSFQTFGTVGKHPAYTKPPTTAERPLPAGPPGAQRRAERTTSS